MFVLLSFARGIRLRPSLRRCTRLAECVLNGFSRDLKKVSLARLAKTRGVVVGDAVHSLVHLGALNEPVGRNDASTVDDRTSIGRFGCDRFRARVEHAYSSADVVCPTRDQAKTKQAGDAFAVLADDHWSQVGGGDVEPRNQIWIGRLESELIKDEHRIGERVTTTHGFKSTAASTTVGAELTNSSLMIMTRCRTSTKPVESRQPTFSHAEPAHTIVRCPFESKLMSSCMAWFGATRISRSFTKRSARSSARSCRSSMTTRSTIKLKFSSG